MNSGNALTPINDRPSYMIVDLAALTHNFTLLKETAGSAKVMAVVKANAYGHGLTTCATRLAACGVDYLGVAFVEEGIELRKAGIVTPILVFGGIFGEQIRRYLEFDLELTASSVSKLQAIDAAAAALKKTARVHLKIDTGMERIGVHYYSAESLFAESLRCKHCQIVGVFSHFATADDPDLAFMKLQLERFLEALSFFERRSLPTPLRHIANSAAMLQSKDTHLDMVRPGIALYGVCPAPHISAGDKLRAVMSLRSTVVYFKVVKEGNSVSYGQRWKAPCNTRVVTIPLGYGDGFFRSLSNRGEVLIRGRRYPIVGSVCMDQMMVNLGPDGEAFNGDEVVLVGSQGDLSITVNQIADLAGTIPWEVLTSTNLRVPRRYVG